MIFSPAGRCHCRLRGTERRRPQEPRLQLRRLLEFRADLRQVAGGGMAARAIGVEERLALLRHRRVSLVAQVPHRSGRRCRDWPPVRPASCRNCAMLWMSSCERLGKAGHAGLRTAVLDHRPDLFILFIVQNYHRADQVRALRAARVFAVAGRAVLLVERFAFRRRGRSGAGPRPRNSLVPAPPPRPPRPPLPPPGPGGGPSCAKSAPHARANTSKKRPGHF